MLKISYAKKSTSLRFISLISLFLFSNLGFALGLGDIELKSHLNEALSARITLSDAEPTPDPSCFTASDASEISAFKKAYVTLKKNNGVSQLSIITYDVITEPIVNLLIAFHCDPVISREYVLLLDPVPTATSPEVSAAKAAPAEQLAPTAPQKNKEPKRKAAKPQTEPVVDSASGSEPILDAPVKKKRKKRAATVEDKLAQAYTGKSASESKAVEPKNATETKPQPTPKTNTDKPYLVISGGNAESSGNNQPNLSLRMETQIDFARTETAPLPSSAEEADEVTVMSNRLAHLEKQILSLQAKNTQLQTENEKIKNESFTISPEVSEWLNRILIGLGIIGVLGIAEMLRRKIMLNRLHQDEAVWFDAEAEQEDLPGAKNIGASIFNEPGFSNSLPGLETNNLATQASFVQAENDEVENVLDHADVFIEHGRPALAIQLLQNHLDDAPAESPAVWLKLLELLAKEGSEADYDVAVKECNQFFNIKMPSFAEAMNQDYSTIEDHPHIVTRLEGVWGSQYAVGFLNDLIYNQQSQPREGFERNTFEELFFLKQIAAILQSDSPIPAAAYKPELVKPLLENAEINRAVFEPEFTSNQNIADDSSEDRQLYDRTSELPAHKYEDRFAETAEPSTTDSGNATKEMVVDEFSKQDFAEQPYEIDMVLDAEELTAEPALPQTLDFEEIDFDVTAEEFEAPILPDATEPSNPSAVSPEKTNFDLEESDADIIRKYLNEAEEKAKKKPAPSNDSNVIEFDWDLPKVDKD